MGKRGFIGLGLGAYLVFTLAQLPAEAVLGRVLAGLPGQAAQVSGRLWAGQLSGLVVQGEALPALSWSVVPSTLLKGRLGLDWQLDGGTGQPSGAGRLELGLGGAVHLSGADLRLPAARLAPHMRLPGLLLDGELSLHLDALSLKARKLEALAGQLTWSQARVQSPYGQAALGSQAVQLSGNEAGGIDGQLKELEGPMDLRGEFHWLPTGAYQSEGSVKQALPPELAQFFALFAKDDGQGRLRFQYQGNYSPVTP
ncbi:MAG: type II secretion system protein N [Gammaproteobacteria bacterium]|nr:type II secretion system protein N [Gammaproteobacteria bacterium]